MLRRCRSRARVAVGCVENDEAPVSYSYQNVELLVRTSGRIRDDGRVRLNGSIEISELYDAERAEPALPPVVRALDHQFDLVVADESTVRLVAVDDPGRGEVTIELTTSIVH